jgi:UDP-2-acetamido-3-amino-2,3-dideoxy-glucuronate N-acetyltransferase
MGNQMISVALIGSGYWGSKIVESLKLNPNVGECQIIDIKNGENIENIRAGIKTAIIATPLWDHFATAFSLLSRGFDCYIEKPMAETSDQCRSLSVYADKQIVMVGHIFIYHPALELVKQALPSIGKVQYVTSDRLNWGIYQTKTTPLLSLLPHDISILLDLFGNITINSATERTFTNNIMPDYIRFDGSAGDVPFTVTGSWYWPERVRKLIIVGDAGHIIWDDSTNTVQVISGNVLNKRLSKLESTILTPDTSTTPLELELNHFIARCIDRSQPKTGCENAFEVAKVIEAVQAKLIGYDITA